MVLLGRALCLLDLRLMTMNMDLNIWLRVSGPHGSGPGPARLGDFGKTGSQGGNWRHPRHPQVGVFFFLLDCQCLEC
jgi:hypothetical protein